MLPTPADKDTLSCSIGAVGSALAASVRRTRSGDADREGCGVAAYVLMDRHATLSRWRSCSLFQRSERRTWSPSRGLLARTPIWIDAARIWDGDEQWYARLVDQAVVCPASPRTARRRRTRRSSAASFAERDGSATNLRRRRDAQQLEPRKGVGWRAKGCTATGRSARVSPMRARSCSARATKASTCS